jgi:prepilin-type N-terminal cleavage/methylation domain-containing protein
MLSKIHKKNQITYGFTLVEILVTVTILSILVYGVLVLINPTSTRNKSRDNKRLSDLATIERMIIEYNLTYRSYPDGAGILRDSMTKPSDTSPPQASSNRGWIDADLSEFNSVLPLDPVNEDDLKYKYYSNGTNYEINTKLEAYTDKMQNDGGNDPVMYEIGTDLNLISP